MNEAAAAAEQAEADAKKGIDKTEEKKEKGSEKKSKKKKSIYDYSDASKNDKNALAGVLCTKILRQAG